MPGPRRGASVPGRAGLNAGRDRDHRLDELGRVFRQESPQAVATLVRLFGDIDVAEEAVQEAFVVATERWTTAGVPPNPGGWITITARNRAIDRLRRESTRHDRHLRAARLADDDAPPAAPAPCATTACG